MVVTDMVLIPVIIGLVQLMKMYGLPKKLMPILAIALGIAGGTFYLFPGDWKSGLLGGLIMGLSASGLYSGSKAIAEKKECSEEEEKNRP